ncbi:hypothetical protein ZONE111904_14965 [Zobellia nedashkovskayae]
MANPGLLERVKEILIYYKRKYNLGNLTPGHKKTATYKVAVFIYAIVTA